MKLGKATIYYFDPNSDKDDSPTDVLSQLLDSRDWLSCHLYDSQEVSIGEWYDDIDLNYSSCTKDTYERYFSESVKLRARVLDLVLSIMETSEITKISIEQAIDMSTNRLFEVNEIASNEFGDEDFHWVKQRYEEILHSN